MCSAGMIDSSCAKGFVRCKVCFIPTVYANEFCKPCYGSLVQNPKFKRGVCIVCLNTTKKRTGTRVKAETQPDMSYWYCPKCSEKEEIKAIFRHIQLYFINGTVNVPLQQKIGTGIYQVFGCNPETPLPTRDIWWTPTFSEEARLFKIEPIKTESHFLWDRGIMHERILYSNKYTCEKTTPFSELGRPPSAPTSQTSKNVHQDSKLQQLQKPEQSGVRKFVMTIDDDEFLKQRAYFLCLFGFRELMG